MDPRSEAALRNPGPRVILGHLVNVPAPEDIKSYSDALKEFFTTGTLEFEERAGRTTLTLTITARSKEARDALLEMRIDAGTARTLDNLGEYLAKKSQTR